MKEFFNYVCTYYNKVYLIYILGNDKKSVVPETKRLPAGGYMDNDILKFMAGVFYVSALFFALWGVFCYVCRCIRFII
jgi:hypothetical protein